MGSLRYAPAAKSSTVTPSFYVRNPEAHGLVSSSALNSGFTRSIFAVAPIHLNCSKAQYAILSKI